MSAIRSSKLLLLAVVAVMAAGVFFRFYNIDKKLLWHDEVYTKFFAAGSRSSLWKAKIFTGRVMDIKEVKALQKNDPHKGVTDTIMGLALDEPQHPPLYYVLARLWVSWFGDDIGTLRLLSALLSLFALPAIFWLSRELFTSVKIAWLSVILLSASPFFVLFAQETREYTLWGLVILLSSASMLRAIRLSMDDASSGTTVLCAWGLYMLFVTMAMYTSFSSVFVIMLQVLFILTHQRLKITRVNILSAISLTLSAFAFLPWALVFADHYEAFRASMAWSRKIVIPRGQLLSTLGLNTSRPLVDFWRGYDGLATVVGVGLSILLIVISLAVLYRKAPKTSTVFVFSLILLPIAVLIVPDLMFGGIRSVSARYLTPSMLGIIIAVAHLLGAKIKFTKAQAALTVVVVSIAMGSCAWNSPRVSVWTKGISYDLPRIANIINTSPSALVVGDQERHNPGNMLALVYLLKPGTRVQFITTEQGYSLPEDPGDVYLFSPTNQFRKTIERQHAKTVLVFKDIYLELWKVVPGSLT